MCRQAIERGKDSRTGAVKKRGGLASTSQQERLQLLYVS